MHNKIIKYFYHALNEKTTKILVKEMTGFAKIN